jgi:hypothetical protein
MSSSWHLGALIQKSSTKITTPYGLHSPNNWYELRFTIKRAQIRTYIAKMGRCCISSTSEISKYRRTWPLAILRHIPIALGASGALGVGWDTPRSIKAGHTPTGTILRPPRRHFIRKCMVMWGKFRLPSTESLKNKTRVVRGGGFWHGGGGGYFCSVFCPRETHTHTRRLVDISTHISRRRNFRETRG